MNNYTELLLILERINETSFSDPEMCPRPCGYAHGPLAQVPTLVFSDLVPIEDILGKWPLPWNRPEPST